MTLTTPELIALQGGPKHGQWLTQADFNEQRATAHYMLNRVPTTQRAAVAILDYHNTGRTTTSHIGKKGRSNVEQIATATIWEHQPGEHHA